ncbi:MAG: TonB-dependent receptor, partial [Gammaproteobacteria bacterium]|nr:TonB-dependent receptor [Gammaproteobacteria bacterium]
PVAVSQCGNDMPNAPDFAAVVGADWTLPINPDVKLVITPNARFESSSQPSPFVPSFKQKSNTVIDLSASFAGVDDRFSVALWGKNLTNENNYTRAFDTVSNLLAPPGTSGSQYSWLIDPRTYGVTFRTKF